jgi:radical SAM protein with 4Fe4S-binding SPASM domain
MPPNVILKPQIGVEELDHFEKDAVHLFIDPEFPNWISTNKIGAFIIKNLKNTSLKDIALKLSKTSNVSPEEILEDSKNFLKELKKREFSAVGSKRGLYPGRSKVVGCGQLQELWIYTNNSCNLRCKHCFVSAGEVSKEEMSTQELKNLIDEASSLGAFRFYFTGGEPFLRDDIIELIEHALKGNKNELIILSNGTLFNQSNLRKLKRFKDSNLKIQVSLEGPNAMVNDKVRGPRSFHRALKGIKNLVDFGMAPIVTTTITKDNIETLIEMPQLLSSLGVKHYHVLFLQNRGRARKSENEISVSPNEITEIMRKLIIVSKRHGIVLDNEMSLHIRAKAKRGRKYDLCNSCFEMLSVDSNGHVYPCAPLNGEKEFNCGSIGKRRLKDIWFNSDTTQAIRENSVSIKEGCRVCSLKFICGGGCFCQSYYASKALGKGDISYRDPYCLTFKELIFDRLWELAAPEGYKALKTGYEPPVVISSMDPKLPSCSVSSTRVKDFEHEIGSFHCSCVLGIEIEGEHKILKGNKNRLAKEACFNERAIEYEDWFKTPIGSRYNAVAKKRIFSLINVKPGDKILEVGCGTGNYSLEISKLGAEVVGVDASEWMLRIAIKNARVNKVNLIPKHSDAQNLPFPDGTFDAIMSINMLEYSQNSQKAVHEMIRVLRKGGQLILGVLNKNSLWGLTRSVKGVLGIEAYFGAGFLGKRELISLLPKEQIEGINLISAIYFPPVNQNSILKASDYFETLWEKILPNSGALTILSATKAP